MKFGKLLNSLKREGWDYVGYKSLKKILKNADMTPEEKEATCDLFAAMLKKDIMAINRHFYSMRQKLGSTLKTFSATLKKNLPRLTKQCREKERSALVQTYQTLRDDVEFMRVYAVVNYLVRVPVFAFYVDLPASSQPAHKQVVLVHADSQSLSPCLSITIFFSNLHFSLPLRFNLSGCAQDFEKGCQDARHHRDAIQALATVLVKTTVLPSHARQR